MYRLTEMNPLVSKRIRYLLLVSVTMTLLLNVSMGVTLSHAVYTTGRFGNQLRILAFTAANYFAQKNGASGGTVFHSYSGRIGNQLFQMASISGIASKNGMDVCIPGGEIMSMFDGVDHACDGQFPWKVVVEDGYAKWQAFDLHHKDTVIFGDLQSYKYFNVDVRKYLHFKPHLLSHANVFLGEIKHDVMVGIHVRRYEGSHLRTPSRIYYDNAMGYFTHRYPSVGFVVICEDPTWCAVQPQFVGSNVYMSSEPQHFAVDMAILSACDHIIISVGTFGWWSAFLGPDSRPSGIVIYYQNEFVVDHFGNVGNVHVADYYPPEWVPLGDEPDTWSLSNLSMTRLATYPDLSLCDATIVTAYYKMSSSKHSHEEYEIWMRNMLSLQDAMIIFTTKDMEDMIYQLRDHALNRTLVVVMALEDTAVVQKYGMDFWKDQNLIDPEKYTHTDPRIYIVWNQKPAFVKHAISLNPFKSSHFLWMDIGCLQQTGYNGDWMVTDATPFHSDKVLMLDVTAMTSNVFLDTFFVNENRIGGGIFGGTIAAMLRFSDEYYKTLSLGAELLQFVGKDQPLMFRTCERVHDLCSKIFPNSKLSSDDPWFYMVPFLMHKLWRNE